MKLKKKPIQKTAKTVTKKRDKDATRAALIKAATQLFALKGYDATRTLEIAQKAKVNEALITRYFGGKSGLLIAVMQDDENQKAIINSDTHCPASDWISFLNQHSNLKEAMKHFFKAGAQHLSDKEEFIRIGLSQALVDKNMGLLLKSKTMDKTVPKVIEGLKSHIKNKKKSLGHSELEALAILMLSVNFAVNFLGRFIHQTDEKTIKNVIDLFTESLASRFE